jgi:hypothetical protein
MRSLEVWIDPGAVGFAYEKPTAEEIETFKRFALSDFKVDLNAMLCPVGGSSEGCRVWELDVWAAQYAEEVYRGQLARLLDDAVKETDAKPDDLARWLEAEAAALRVRWKPEQDS